MKRWPCITPGCHQDEDCADALGGACGYYGDDEPEPLAPVDLVPVDERADDEFADGVPLPDEPDVEPEPWDPQPIRADEIPVEPPPVDEGGQEYDPVPLSAEEEEARLARYERARRVHVVDLRGAPSRLGNEFDPRGRHVGCDGDPATGERGCRAAPGIACRGPVGFVHPSRLRSERMLFGLDPEPRLTEPTAAV